MPPIRRVTLPNWQDSTAAHLTLGGLQKTTLIDYPGKVACVVFFSGCNFHCPYCHNPALAKGRQPNPISLTDLLAFLDQRRGFLEGVVVSGGEPTLSPHLGDLCRCCHALGLEVKLDTNGSQPEVLAQLLDQRLVDYVAMDLKTNPDGYGELCNQPGISEQILSSIHYLMAHGRNYEFRTTCVRPYVNAAVVEEIARLIQGAPSYVLQTFQPGAPGDLLDPDFGMPGVKTDHAGPSGNGYSPPEMEVFQQTAAVWVKQCRIR